jgi:hypothetical protein
VVIDRQGAMSGGVLGSRKWAWAPAQARIAALVATVQEATIDLASTCKVSPYKKSPYGQKTHAASRV